MEKIEVIRELEAILIKLKGENLMPSINIKTIPTSSKKILVQTEIDEYLFDAIKREAKQYQVGFEYTLARFLGRGLMHHNAEKRRRARIEAGTTRVYSTRILGE